MFLVFLLGVLLGIPILILAMILTSYFSGGVNFGDLRGILLKAVPLLLVVHALSISLIGRVLSGAVWWLGLKLIFDLEVREVRMLVYINWLLNILVTLALLAIFLP